MTANSAHQISSGPRVLIHLSSGIGNIVLATPLLIAVHELGCSIDVRIDADYAETAELLAGWSIVRKVFAREPLPESDDYEFLIPAIPPFYWDRFRSLYQTDRRALSRPPDGLFYENEQSYYLAFARQLGYRSSRQPLYRLPIVGSPDFGVTAMTVVLAPGCKTGAMAAKRWPFFGELAEEFEDVAVVGTGDDLFRYDGEPLRLPGHARVFCDRLGLRQCAELLAAAGVVVGNDSGLSHVAAAVGTPTIMIFGPTGHRCLGTLPSNVTLLRSQLECRPCWQTRPLAECGGDVACLAEISVERVAGAVRWSLGQQQGG